MAYGQLILEGSAIDHVSDDMVEQIFDFMIRDFSKYALQLYSKPSSTQQQMDLCLKMIQKPADCPERFERIWETCVYTQKDAYKMNE